MVKIKNKIDLWDLPNKRVYVKIEDSVIKTFFEYSTNFAGSEIKLANLLGIKRIGNIWYFKNGIFFTPLDLIMKILKKLPEEKRNEFVKNIEQNLEKLRFGYGNAKSIINPRLPIMFSLQLARIAGHLVGDGGIGMAKGSYPVYYTNRCDVLIEQFKKDMTEIFGDASVYDYHYRNKNDGLRMVRYPSIAGIILMDLFGPMIKGLKHVPSLVLESDKNSKSLFLRALFDDEGCVSSNRIVLGMSNKTIIEKVKKMLNEFGIETGKISKGKATERWKARYYLAIFGRNDIHLFAQKIGFDHPEKKEKLNYLLKSYENKVLHYKKGEMRKLILKILKNEGPLGVCELAKKLNRKPGHRLREHLRKLKKEGKVKVQPGRWNLKIYSLNIKETLNKRY